MRVILLILALSIATWSDTASDSLIYYQRIESLDTTKIEPALWETIQSLASIGLYKRANSLLPLTNKNEKSEIETSIELFHYYNNIEDENKKELNTNQKDSIDLLKKSMAGVGVHVYIPIQGNRSTLKLTPILYVTNIINRVGLDYNHYFLDSSIILTEQLSFEKVVGTYIQDTISDAGDSISTIHEKYKGPNYKPDSSDVIYTVSALEYRKLLNNFSFSIPLRHVMYSFRSNKPILSSRSNISLGPEFELFSQRRNLTFDLSASLFIEYQDYFGLGRVRDELNSDLFNANFYDKVYATPQVTSEIQYKQLKLDYSLLCLFENYTERESQLNAFAQVQNEDKANRKSLGDITKNIWIQQDFNTGIELSERFQYSIGLEYLSVLERYHYAQYESATDGWQCVGKGLDKKGTAFVLKHEIQKELGTLTTFKPGFLTEWRDAPIYDSLVINNNNPTLFMPVYESQYLWEHYTAHEPSLAYQLQGKSQNFFLLKQSIRWEKIQEDEQIQKEIYQRSDEVVYKTMLQGQLQLKHALRFSINGLFSIRKSDDGNERNIASSVSVTKGF